MAFRMLGLNPAQTVKWKQYKEFCTMLNLDYSGYKQSEEGVICGNAKGDRMFHLENMSRIRNISLKQVWQEDKEDQYDVSWFELELFQNAWAEYKASRGLLDYTDTLVEWLRSGAVPDIELLFVDEAQDLSPLQWQLVEMLQKQAKQTYIAGDDDQSIYRFSGADVQKFIGLEGDVRVLNKSYRLPKAVYDVAQQVVHQIRHRREKHFDPSSKEGEVKRWYSLDNTPLETGEWLLLARNTYLLQQYVDVCRHQGYPYTLTSGRSPFDGDLPKAIFWWERLRKGQSARLSHIKRIYDCISSQRIMRGCKLKVKKLPRDTVLTLDELKKDYGLCVDSPWFEAFDMVSAEDIEYFRSVLRQGEKLTVKPRITISTFHSIKGGEADHVLIATDMAARTYREYQENSDDELRVLYVAVTRAKQSLHILEPTSLNCYEV